MIRQNNKSIKTRAIILLALYVVLIPFSLSWYNVLTNIDCEHKGTFESSYVKTGSSVDVTPQNCLEQTNFHWLKFYGINGIIYGAQLIGLIMTVKRKSTN